MKHAHSKYDDVQDTSGRIPIDEPVFLLRGADPIAVATVKFWLDLSKDAGIHRDKAQIVTNHMTKMSEWYDNTQKGD